MATIKEVAALAKVSMATASHVINGTKPVSDELRERVSAAIQALNYRQDFIARGLKKGHADFIVLILPELESPIYSSIAMEVLRPAAKMHWHVIQLTSEGNMQKELELLSSPVLSSCRGLIMLSHYLTYSQIKEKLPPNTPIVMLSDQVNDAQDKHTLSFHLLDVVYQQVRSMADAGYRSIGLIINEYPSSCKIIDAYRRAVTDSGLEVHFSLIKSESASANGGYKAMNFLFLQKRKIDSVFICDEAMMLGASRSFFMEKDRLCDDFLFSSVTCPSMAYSMPWISSVALQTAVIAGAAASMLLEPEAQTPSIAQPLFSLPLIHPRKEQTP